jgi:hypothetical protein
MIDQNQQPTDTGAPTEAPNLSAMETNLMQFLDPTYDDQRPAEEPAAEGTPDPQAAQAEQAPAVESAPPAPSNAPKAEPVAEEGTDPALLAKFFTTEKPTEQAAPAPAVAEQPKAPEPWAPFQAPLELPPQLAAALFESDDTQIRAQALGVVINSIGNGIAQLVEKRFQEHYAPQMQSQILAAQTQRSAAERIDQDFYGAYPQLAAHRDVVGKAFGILAQQKPDAVYGPEIRKQAGELAIAALSKMGVQFQTATPTPAPAKPAPQQQYIAGSARPANFTPQQDDSPAALVDLLSQF